MEGPLLHYLAPVLPFLLDAGREAARRASAAIGEAAWQAAQSMWQRLSPVVKKDPALSYAVEQLGNHPDDAQAFEAVKQALEKVLADDRELATELERLLKSAPRYEIKAEHSAVAWGDGVAIKDGMQADRGSFNVGRDFNLSMAAHPAALIREATPGTRRVIIAGLLTAVCGFATAMVWMMAPFDSEVGEAAAVGNIGFALFFLGAFIYTGAILFGHSRNE